MTTPAFKVKKTSKEKNNELVLSVEGSKEISSKAYAMALRDASNFIDMPGFRKGKAPKELVEKKLGKPYISQKAFEAILYNVLSQVASQENIDIVDVVEILSFELLPETPLTFSALVELKPEINLGKYKGLKVNALKYKFDKDLFIKKSLDKIANNLATFTKVLNRGAKRGDLVSIDFEGAYDDGSEVPGGSVNNYQVVLADTNLLPEFVEKIEGIKPGEVKEITVNIPQSSTQEPSVKNAKFKVKLNEIQEKIIPPIDDNLACALNFKNILDLENKIEEHMHEIEEENSKVDLENKLIDELVKTSRFEISQRMTDKEVDYLLRDLKDKCQKDGVSWDTFKSDEKNKDLLEKAKELAKKRISVDLALSAIITNEKIQVKEDELEEEIKVQARHLKGNQEKIEINDGIRKVVKVNMLRTKAIQFLLANNQPLWEEKIVNQEPGEEVKNS